MRLQLVKYLQAILQAPVLTQVSNIRSYIEGGLDRVVAIGALHELNDVLGEDPANPDSFVVTLYLGDYLLDDTEAVLVH